MHAAAVEDSVGRETVSVNEFYLRRPLNRMGKQISVVSPIYSLVPTALGGLSNTERGLKFAATKNRENARCVG